MVFRYRKMYKWKRALARQPVFVSVCIFWFVVQLIGVNLYRCRIVRNCVLCFIEYETNKIKMKRKKTHIKWTENKQPSRREIKLCSVPRLLLIMIVGIETFRQIVYSNWEHSFFAIVFFNFWISPQEKKKNVTCVRHHY